MKDRKNHDDYVRKTLEKISRERGFTDLPHYDLKHPTSYQVQVLPDENVSRGNFRPHPQYQGAYLAHPATIKAMRSDILVSDENFDETSESIVCHSCRSELDLQFWVNCPYCESHIKV